MSDFLDYRGPEMDYKPQIKDMSGRTQSRSTENPTRGYYDLNYLNEMLDKISNAASATYSYGEAQLSNFALNISSAGEELKKAHDLVYPADNTPSYITFDEYKYLLTTTPSTAVEKVRSYYESRLRNVNGTGILDLVLLTKLIHLEVSRIRNFILTYIGELDETAEFRLVELFQDWTETAFATIQRIDKTTKTKVVAKIPGAELDELTPELSTKYQVLFQTKLNQINSTIGEVSGKLEKNWNMPAVAFYNKALGPALLFQIKVASEITDPNNLSQRRLPLLSEEAKGTISGLASNYTVVLSDLIRRNQLFIGYTEEILNNIDRRDIYKNYIDQLSDKGTSIASDFIQSSDVEQSETVIKAPHLLSHTVNTSVSSTSVRPSHSDLMDRDLGEAHPQYLLRSGGDINGNVTMSGGARIDGIIPSRHRHDGQDGSQKISGSHIVPGSITEDNIDTGATTLTPRSLVLSNQVASVVPPGLVKVTAEVSFVIDNAFNVTGYEFEVIKL